VAGRCGAWLACRAGPWWGRPKVNAAVVQIKAAGLPTVFMSRTDKVLPDAGGPGKGGIDHFDSSPIIGQTGAIAGQVQSTVTCP
jgi:hypothetical protein